MFGKKRRNLILCTAVLCAFLALSGCKPSPAFVETVYDARAAEVKEDAGVSSVENDADNTDMDTALPPQAFEEDVGDPRDREREDATAGEEERQETAPEPEHNEDEKTCGGTGGTDAAVHRCGTGRGEEDDV